MEIKTAFIFDFGDDIEHEADVAVMELEQIADEHKIVKSVVGETVESLNSKRFDLIILDYGGVSIGGWDHAKFHIRHVCEYAQEHPGCLLVIWTQYTIGVYQDELEDAFGDCRNIVCRYGNFYDQNDEDKFAESFLQWFPTASNSNCTRKGAEAAPSGE